MSEPATLAEHIDQQSEVILDLWRTTLEADWKKPSDRGDDLSRAERLDHLPELLDLLADRLRGEKAEVSSTGREHGRHR